MNQSQSVFVISLIDNAWQCLAINRDFVFLKFIVHGADIPDAQEVNLPELHWRVCDLNCYRDHCFPFLS